MSAKTIRIDDAAVIAKAIKAVQPPRTSYPAIRAWDSTKSWPCWELPVVRRQPGRDQQLAFARARLRLFRLRTALYAN